jgi:hypothetical protein
MATALPSVVDKRTMKLPYGVADFYSLRTEGQLYVDRTDRIRTLEELGKALLFLRPRRFGKSLWLSVLANYYDLRTAAEHESLFATSFCAGTSPRSIRTRRHGASMPTSARTTSGSATRSTAI